MFDNSRYEPHDSAGVDAVGMTVEELREYHTLRRGLTVVVSCEKSAVPMLWLDSSVLMDLAKIDNKENVEKVRATRLSKLRQIVRKAVRQQKLICPEWDQSLEFEGKRLEPQIRRVMSDLSCGAHCVPHAGVKDQQIFRGLQGYIAAASTVHIPAKIHFYEDPRERVREAIASGFIVEANMPKPAEWIAKADRDNATARRQVEALRQEYLKKKQTFQEQLALERIGESDVMLQMMSKFLRTAATQKHDLWDFMGVHGFFLHQEMWRRLGGPGMAGMELFAVYSFMRSPYYWELPVQDISCRLSADLLVRHIPVKTGDSRDIDHLATAMPVAQYLVADKAMVDRCRRLRLDRRWNAKLFSTKTMDILCDELDALPEAPSTVAGNG